jgi:two-component system, cell cycle sensor histidine kinase and response regulator CckA
MVYLDLILNLALLVALSVVSGFIGQRWPKHTRLGVLLQGALYGSAAVAGMLRPLNMGGGLIFDGRSVVLSLAALYFGPWAATVAGPMALACRIATGGVGATMGVLVILSSLGIGLMAHFRLKTAAPPPSAWYLYRFGLAVHLAMVALMFVLPADIAWSVVRRIGLPVMLLYPLATILAGKILSDQERTTHFVAALRQSEEDYRKLFEEHAAVKLIIAPGTGAIVDANRAAADYYGWSREELRRMNIEQINTLSLAEIAKEIERVRAGQQIHFEFKHRRADGSIRDVEVFSSRITIKGGVFLHSIIHDITARKQSEEQNRTLQDQLIQAQKMESIGRLAGGVAHDFNNMLALIIGHAEMALERVDAAEPLHADLTEILAAGRRSADLTRQLLAFARKQTIRPKVLDLNETMAGMLKMLQRIIGEDIALVWKPGAKLWRVHIDPVQVDQIVANLAVNARDALAGQGHLTIETENVVLDKTYGEARAGFVPGEYVQLVVSDSGCGMDKEIVAHLFEPFFTTKEIGKGTGLGLATVYGIVSQNNGFINVYSEPGQGTVFRIYLPRAHAVETTEPKEVEAKPFGGAETVLLVEDEAGILSLGKAILKQYGYTVLAAPTPQDALELVRRHAGPIDLLITDVVMPGMNGKVLSEEIAVLRPGVKMLFMSGYTADVIAHHGVLEAGVHYLQKPFAAKAMAAKVREVLDGV